MSFPVFPQPALGSSPGRMRTRGQDEAKDGCVCRHPNGKMGLPAVPILAATEAQPAQKLI